MWIMTQKKNRIVNSDQVIDIFVDSTGWTVCANTTEDSLYVTLGTYDSRDTSLKVLSIMLRLIGNSDATYLAMPLGGDAKEWTEKVDHELNKIGM